MLLSIDIHCCATGYNWGIQDLRFSMTITERKPASVQFQEMVRCAKLRRNAAPVPGSHKRGDASR